MPPSNNNQNNELNSQNAHHHVHNHHALNNNNQNSNNQASSNQINSNNNQIIVNPLNGTPVQCTIDSVASSNLKFHWMLSLSSSTPPTNDLNQRKLNQYTTVAHNLKNISSIFLLQDAFLTSTHRNHAQLLCWADNEIGSQKVPCVFNLIKAGKCFFF